jgi:molybdopterin-guanine dinucleotide biosynthesis protein A
MENTATAILGVVLAGGLSRRMGGGDKGLLPLAGEPVAAHVIRRVRPQVAHLVINANGDDKPWQRFGLPVVPDTIDDRPGPLAGILAAMEWGAAHEPDCRWVLAVPCDTPFLPADLAGRLMKAAASGPWAVPRSGGRRHPVAGLFSMDLRGALAEFLAAGGRRAGEFCYDAPSADFDAEPVDPFFNVNTPEQLAEAETIVVELTRQRGDDT